MSVAALVLVFLLFGIYSWLAAINCGLAVLRLLPSSTLTRHALKLFTPLWEIATLLVLVAGATGFGVLFQHGLLDIIGSVRKPIIFGAVGLGARLLLLLWAFYRKSRTGITAINWLILAASLMAPIGFGAAVIHLLTGRTFWHGGSSQLLVIMLVVSLCVLTLSLVSYVVGQTPRGRLQLLARWLNIALCLLGTVVLVRVSVHDLPHLLTLSLAWFVGLLVFIIVLQVIAWIGRRERYMWWYLSIVSVVGPILLALANRPYLEYPNHKLNVAYIDGSHGTAAVTVLAGVTLLLVVELLAIAWRLLSRHQAPRHQKPASS